MKGVWRVAAPACEGGVDVVLVRLGVLGKATQPVQTLGAGEDDGGDGFRQIVGLPQAAGHPARVVATTKRVSHTESINGIDQQRGHIRVSFKNPKQIVDEFFRRAIADDTRL
ncbi:hypothetical protein D3C87_1664360 [compost metagenome]